MHAEVNKARGSMDGVKGVRNWKRQTYRVMGSGETNGQLAMGCWDTPDRLRMMLISKNPTAGRGVKKAERRCGSVVHISETVHAGR